MNEVYFNTKTKIITLITTIVQIQKHRKIFSKSKKSKQKILQYKIIEKFQLLTGTKQIAIKSVTLCKRNFLKGSFFLDNLGELHQISLQNRKDSAKKV